MNKLNQIGITLTVCPPFVLLSLHCYLTHLLQLHHKQDFVQDNDHNNMVLPFLIHFQHYSNVVHNDQLQYHHDRDVAVVNVVVPIKRHLINRFIIIITNFIKLN